MRCSSSSPRRLKSARKPEASIDGIERCSLSTTVSSDAPSAIHTKGRRSNGAPSATMTEVAPRVGLMVAVLSGTPSLPALSSLLSQPGSSLSVVDESMSAVTSSLGSGKSSAMRLRVSSTRDDA